MHIDPLESRRHFAITSALDAAGTVTVQGDAANDVITVQESGSWLVVNQSPADMSWTPPTLPALVPPTSINRSTGFVRPPFYVPGYFSLAAVKKIVVRGGAGDDMIVVNSSIPADVSGEDGNDVVYGSFGNDNLDGGNGNDQLQGRAGNDVLTGDAGNDLLGGDDGNDTVSGGDDDDVLMADNGNDTYSGGNGRDLLTYNNHIASARASYVSILVLDVADDLCGFVTDDPNISDPEGWLERDHVSPDVEDFIGSAGDDFIYGTGADNFIDGGLGNDVIYGAGGNDMLYGKEGNDDIHGMWGNDLIDGGDGDDTLSGDDGADSLTGGAGSDSLDGGAGNDSLDGGAGTDWLRGGDGDDVLYARDLEFDHLDGGNGFDRAYVDKIRVGFTTYLVDDLANVEYW